MKNKIKYIFYGLFTMVICYCVLPVKAFAAAATGYSFENEELKVVYIGGMILMAIRIVVPLILIVVAMSNLIKAMMQKDDNHMKQVITNSIIKVVFAIAIFLIPTLIALLMRLINQNSLWATYSSCLAHPSSCPVTMWEGVQ